MNCKRKEKLTVLGVMKTDIEGGKRMQNALETIKPDLIAGESSQLLAAKASTREMLWSVLFDELKVPLDIQKKWEAIQTHKEHHIAQQYAASNCIPYFMIDHEEEIAPYSRTVSLYAQQELVDNLRKQDDPKRVRSYIAKIVNRKFDKHFEDQITCGNINYYYSSHYLCKGNAIRYAEEHAFHFLHELNMLADMYKNMKICMFIDAVHVVNPRHATVLKQLSRPLYNLRYYIGEEYADYHQLVEFL